MSNNKEPPKPLAPIHLNKTPFREFLQQHAKVINLARLAWVEPVLGLYHGCLWSAEYSYRGEHTLQYLREFSAKFDSITDLQTINIFSNKLDRITIHASYTKLDYVPEKNILSAEKIEENQSNKQGLSNSYIYWGSREWKLNQKENKKQAGLGFFKAETFSKSSPAVTEPSQPDEQPESSVTGPSNPMLDGQKPVLPKKPITVTEPSLLNRQKLPLSVLAFLNLVQQRANVVKLGQLIWVEPVLSLHHSSLWSTEYSYHGEHTLQYLREFSAKFDRLTDLRTVNIFSNKFDRITIHATELYYSPKENILPAEEIAKNQSNRQRRSRDWKLKQQEKTLGLGFVKGETFSKSAPAVVKPAQRDEQPKYTIREPTMLDKQKPVFPKKPTVTFTEPLLDRQKLPPFLNSKPPVVKLTKTLAGYAKKMRLRDPYIYKLVRNYLGYLREAPDGQTFEGESRVTSEIKIQNEGLPLGFELEKLFYEFLIE